MPVGVGSDVASAKAMNFAMFVASCHDNTCENLDVPSLAKFHAFSTSRANQTARNNV